MQSTLINPLVFRISCDRIITPAPFLQAVFLAHRHIIQVTCGVVVPDTLWIPPLVSNVFLSMNLREEPSPFELVQKNFKVVIRVKDELDTQMVLFAAKSEYMKNPASFEWLFDEGKLYHPLAAVVLETQK